MPRSLPPLNAIRAFVAAAKQVNFSRAADDLGVTQSAVSKQIQTLEDYIGAQLFERAPGDLQLTEAGRTLYEQLAPAFGAINEVFGVHARRPVRSNVVRIATAPSFAAYFLAPRLDAFDATFPDTDLQILTSDRLVDIDREDVDIAVRFGVGWAGDASAAKVGSGAFTPVAAPALLARFDGDVQALMASPTRRIQCLPPNEWDGWFEADAPAALRDKPTFLTTHLAVAMEAVSDGGAYALLPEVIAGRRLDSGALQRLSERRIQNAYAFYMIDARRALRPRLVADVKAWIMDEAGA
ncbi:MAG: LysR family transcriptional regulator [Pseudomonadota bacterium]